MNTAPTNQTPTRVAAAATDSICFAELEGGSHVVIRVMGRGSFANSVELKKIADVMAATPKRPELIFDMTHCQTMDSTFMGVLASIGLQQKKSTGHKMPVVNANEQTLRLMKTLGLTMLMEVRAATGTEAAQLQGGTFNCTTPPEVGKQERIVHMIEAHQNLVDIDSQNAVRFESVLKYLQESLHKPENGSDNE